MFNSKTFPTYILFIAVMVVGVLLVDRSLGSDPMWTYVFMAPLVPIVIMVVLLGEGGTSLSSPVPGKLKRIINSALAAALAWMILSAFIFMVVS